MVRRVLGTGKGYRGYMVKGTGYREYIEQRVQRVHGAGYRATWYRGYRGYRGHMVEGTEYRILGREGKWYRV